MDASLKIMLFLFAHQDDECGVFQCIKQAIENGYRVCCAYLTDGGLCSSSARRNKESLYVLSQLGVNQSDVFFVGEALGIKDGALVQSLDIAAHWLDAWLANYQSVRRIYIPAWEGGHPDHDALHAITLFVTHEKKMLNQVRQFPLYNAYACKGALFRVFYPLLENGAMTARKIPWCNRLYYMRLCLSYSSQWRTWLGLFPFVVLHYLFHGVEFSQEVSLSRVLTKPHSGSLYYEKRGFLTWENMIQRINLWQQ